MEANKSDILRAKFKLAVEHANRPNKASSELSTDKQLKFYALFKQATEGACKEAAPSRVNFVKYAKWQAWHDLKTMSSEAAMRKYLNEMDKVEPDWKEAVQAAYKIKLRSKL